ncbi:MAG: hypothetical protein E6G67_04715, partial [Actinobacteria bacterium]
MYREAAVARWQARQQLVQELSTLSAHLNAATARWLELALEARRQGVAAGDDFGRYLPPRLRRLLEARDQGCCRWPGCDNQHHLAAHRQ